MGKRVNPTLALSALILYLAAACSAPPAGEPAPPTAAATPAVPLTTPTAAPSASPEATPTLDPDLPARTHYSLNAVLDYDVKIVTVDETITFVNRTGEVLEQVVLSVQPNLWSGGFNLKTLSADGSEVTGYVLDGQRLEVPLAVPLAPYKVLTLSLSYRLLLPEMPAYSDPNDIRPQIYGYSTRQVNMTDWYPFIVPYAADEGWLLYNPWYYGEHLMYDSADFDVTLTFLDPATMPFVAASGRQTRSEGGTLAFRLDRGRSFAIAMSRQFVVKREQVGDVTVLAYHFPFDELAGQAMLEATVQALKLYSDTFGPYPHASLSAVQGDFDDGMEYSGLFFISKGFFNNYDGTPKNYLTFITVHETAHQWWFDLIGNNQAMEPWLDEALCTYSERLYYETYYPDAVEWWWVYRTYEFQQPGGPMDTDIYHGNGYRRYVDAVYLRGASFLADLRTRIGDEAFFAFLKDYTARLAFQQASTQDFFAVLKDHSAADISDLIEQYFSTAP